MWSQIIKPDEEVVKDKVKTNEDIKTIPIVSGECLSFKREIKAFIEEYRELLDNLYNKHFKDYDHISKKDFYIFAYTNERYRR